MKNSKKSKNNDSNELTFKLINPTFIGDNLNKNFKAPTIIEAAEKIFQNITNTYDIKQNKIDGFYITI